MTPSLSAGAAYSNCQRVMQWQIVRLRIRIDFSEPTTLTCERERLVCFTFLSSHSISVFFSFVGRSSIIVAVGTFVHFYGSCIIALWISLWLVWSFATRSRTSIVWTVFSFMCLVASFFELHWKFEICDWMGFVSIIVNRKYSLIKLHDIIIEMLFTFSVEYIFTVIHKVHAQVLIHCSLKSIILQTRLMNCTCPGFRCINLSKTWSSIFCSSVY